MITTATQQGATIPQKTKRDDPVRSVFRKDVIDGLSLAEKSIPSKYFYDSEGDRLFQAIMASPDYYPARCEAEIFRMQSSAITRALSADRKGFQVIDLGAGDGSKTMKLLQKWSRQDFAPIYRPTDISPNALEMVGTTMRKAIPQVRLDPLQGEHESVLERLGTSSGDWVFLFLGSNIGNLERTEAVLFLRRIADRMSGEDRSLVGFDLKKEPSIIRRAYNDRAGLTREFNFNLLRRINRELGADFHLDRFIHEPVYDPQQGRALSYLVSTQEQEVKLPGAAVPFHFEAWEAIHTETSHKYDRRTIEALARDAGMQVLDIFTDRRNYFADAVLGLR